MTCKNLVGCGGRGIGTNPSIGLETVALRDFRLLKDVEYDDLVEKVSQNTGLLNIIAL